MKIDNQDQDLFMIRNQFMHMKMNNKYKNNL